MFADELIIKTIFKAGMTLVVPGKFTAAIGADPHEIYDLRFTIYDIRFTIYDFWVSGIGYRQNCHSGEGRNLLTSAPRLGIPASAGMTSHGEPLTRHPIPDT